jgi:hypothetical protein
MKKLWTGAHTLASGFLLGVSLMTAAIWYAAPSKAQSAQTVVIPIQDSWQFGPSSGLTAAGIPYAGYRGSFSQDLGISPREVQKPSPGWQYGTEGTYTLTFSEQNYLPSYPGRYDVEISFGTQQLCGTYGWGTSKANKVTLSCPSSNYMVFGKSLPGGEPEQGSNNLFLTFTVDDGSANGGWPVTFDKFSLTFTPTTGAL